MQDFITEQEPTIRLAVFLGVFAVMGFWEILLPRRRLTAPKAWRWLNNLAITFLNTAILRLVFPVLAVGLSLIAAEKGWGLFNMVDAPLWLAVVLSVVLQDLVIYGQHVAFHKVPVLWRLHKMHHADPDIDVTTGARFHPLEIALSMILKFAVVILLGPPAVAVILFEVILNATAMFNHANVRLAAPLDRLIRMAIVTPDMHRVHHSVIGYETDSNYGFNLSCWDRLFGTYRQAPEAGHQGMTIGLPEYQEKRRQSLFWMLALPFRPVQGRKEGKEETGG